MSLRVLTPSILEHGLTPMMDDNRYQQITFTFRVGDPITENVRIAKASQQQAGVGEFIAMGLQVVNVIGETDMGSKVGATFEYDGKLWEVREPTVIGADNVTRTTLATTTI